MSVTKDPKSPLYVPEENRRIARERANEHVKLIADYLEVRDRIPTGFNCWDRIQENRKKIVKLLGGRASDWNDWKWHIRNLIKNSSTIAGIAGMTEEAQSEVDATAEKYRWQIS